jgi:RND superfamily putative drug exporter
VVTLVTAALGYLVADRAIGLFGELTGTSAPSQLEPVVVALMLGISTDYSIFFLSGMQRRLREGRTGRDAAREAVTEYLPIVAVAGLTVAAGVATLAVAESALFRAFGPGLALTVLIGLATSTTVVPAMMAILGRWTFWPASAPPRRRDVSRAAVPSPDEPCGLSGTGPRPPR